MQKTINVRVFLASYMIRQFPTHVFENIGAREEALIAAAVEFNALFERICQQLIEGDGMNFSSAVDVEDRSRFTDALSAYTKAFLAWKQPDADKISARIKSALRAIMTAKEKVPQVDDAALAIEMGAHIDRLRGKLCTVAGRAVLDAFDLEMAHRQHNQQQPAPGATGYMRDTLDNEELAHEILLDPSFELTVEFSRSRIGGNTPMLRAVNDSLHEAYISSLATDLNATPPCHARAFAAIQDVIDSLSHAGQDEETQRRLRGLDIESLRTANAGLAWDQFVGLCETLQGALKHIHSLSDFDIDTLSAWPALHSRLQAPEDPAATFCSVLDYFIQATHVVRVSSANTRMRLLIPTIMHNGVEYEREKFQAKVNAGHITLERTRGWLRDVISVTAVKIQCVVDRKPNSVAAVHAKAMIALVSDSRKKAETFPEVIMLDARKLLTIAEDIESITLAITRAAMVKALAPPDKGAALYAKALASKSTSAFVDGMRATECLTPGQFFRVEKAIVKLDQSPTHMATEFVRLRILRTFEYVVEYGTMPPPDPSLYPRDVGFFADRITKSAAVFSNIADFNMRIHGPLMINVMSEEAAKLID